MSAPARGRHAAPSRRSATVRRLAVTATAVTAAAVPLAAAATAHAATTTGTPAKLTPGQAQAVQHAVTQGVDQVSGAAGPALPPAPSGQLDPNLLRTGSVGTLTSGFAPQTQNVTGGVVNQTSPVVDNLHGSGVPTVGDVASRVGGSQVPMVGTVGQMTQELPVSSMVESGNPFTGALNNLAGL